MWIWWCISQVAGSSHKFVELQRKRLGVIVYIHMKARLAPFLFYFNKIWPFISSRFCGIIARGSVHPGHFDFPLCDDVIRHTNNGGGVQPAAEFCEDRRV